jgi:hypothetical protein
MKHIATSTDALELKYQETGTQVLTNSSVIRVGTIYEVATCVAALVQKFYKTA